MLWFEPMNFKAVLKILGGVVLCAQTVQACPPEVEAMKSKFLGNMSVCEIHDRYQNALSKLRAQGVKDPEAIGNLKAPRFIFRPDWLKARSIDPQLALKLYKPAPNTWLDWAAAAKIVDTEAANNFANKKLPLISIEWLKNVHGQSLSGLSPRAAEFRKIPVLGPNVFASSALTIDKAAGVQSIKYQSALHPGTPLVTFTPTQCLEDRDAAFNQLFWEQYKNNRMIKSDQWPALPENSSFTAADGTQRTCGFIRYAAAEEVEPQLQRWVNFVNRTTRTWGSLEPENDPIVVAMHAQRWFVSIHPFEDGNGRVSRFAMEWLLKSVGLPAPVIEDMNNDMYMTEGMWARELGIGIRRAIVELESCSRDLSQPGCQPIASK